MTNLPDLLKLNVKRRETNQRYSNLPPTKKTSARHLNEISRIRLSQNFILRDFLFCASAAAGGFSNAPEDSAAVVAAGRTLCERVLEPILSRFGRFAITYGYQSRESLEVDLRRENRSFERNSSSPHQWDRGTFGEQVYARVDILPFCVEDGEVSKKDFAEWIMMNLDVDLLMQWSTSNVCCITIGPQPRRVWLEWGRPSKGEKHQTVFMGAHYWREVFPQLPEVDRPRHAPSCTNGSINW